MPDVLAPASETGCYVYAVVRGDVDVEGILGVDDREVHLVDAGDVVIHLFRPEVRSFYNLERMWGFGDSPAPPVGMA